MTLRDDVRWLCETADGLLVGWCPSRLPFWSTKEGEKLGWLVLLLWRKFYDASMARITLEAEVSRLKDDVDGLRATNEQLTDLLDQHERETVCAVLTGSERPDGFYWVQISREGEEQETTVAQWATNQWWYVGEGAEVSRVLGWIPRPRTETRDENLAQDAPSVSFARP